MYSRVFVTCLILLSNVFGFHQCTCLISHTSAYVCANIRGMILKFWSWRDISVTSNATCLELVSNNNIFFFYAPPWQVLWNLKERPENDPKTAIPSMHWPISQTVHIRDLTIQTRAVSAIHIYGCVMFIQKSICPVYMMMFLYDLGLLGP